MMPTSLNRDDAAKVLGIDVDADEQMITRAWRKLSMVKHPDLGGSLTEQQEINLARETLLAPEEEEVLPDPQAQPVTQYRYMADHMRFALIICGTGAGIAVVLVVLVLAPTTGVLVMLSLYAVGLWSHVIWVGTGHVPVTRLVWRFMRQKFQPRD